MYMLSWQYFCSTKNTCKKTNKNRQLILPLLEANLPLSLAFCGQKKEKKEKANPSLFEQLRLRLSIGNITKKIHEKI